jgi:hypothetical protein
MLRLRLKCEEVKMRFGFPLLIAALVVGCATVQTL